MISELGRKEWMRSSPCFGHGVGFPSGDSRARMAPVGSSAVGNLQAEGNFGEDCCIVLRLCEGPRQIIIIA